MKKLKEDKIRVAVFGTGAMGSLFAMRLNSVAYVNVFGSWKKQIKALNNGLTLHELDGVLKKESIKLLLA